MSNLYNGYYKLIACEIVQFKKKLFSATDTVLKAQITYNLGNNRKVCNGHNKQQIEGYNKNSFDSHRGNNVLAWLRLPVIICEFLFVTCQNSSVLPCVYVIFCELFSTNSGLPYCSITALNSYIYVVCHVNKYYTTNYPCIV